MAVSHYDWNKIIGIRNSMRNSLLRRIIQSRASIKVKTTGAICDVALYPLSTMHRPRRSSCPDRAQAQCNWSCIRCNISCRDRLRGLFFSPSSVGQNVRVDRSIREFCPYMRQNSWVDISTHDFCPYMGQNSVVDRSTRDFCPSCQPLLRSNHSTTSGLSPSSRLKMGHLPFAFGVKTNSPFP